jgi:transketolase
MRTTFIETLLDLAKRDQRIWLLTADLGFSVLEPFIERFPDRFVNVGVAEQNLIGIAAGLARTGLKPFVYSIANFPTLRCLEQIRNDVCYHGADVKIVAVGGGLAYGPQGYTHHGVEDLAVMRCLPGLTVVAPADPIETRLATRAIADLAGPAYLRLGKAKEPVVHQREPRFELGKAITVRPGKDLTLISTGGMLGDALAAAEELAPAGLQARVLSMPTVKPLDAEAVRRAARQTRAILTVEEHSVTGGLGSAVADMLMEAGLRVRFRKLGTPDQMYHLIGSQTYLKRNLIGDIAASARALLASRGRYRRPLAPREE